MGFLTAIFAIGAADAIYGRAPSRLRDGAVAAAGEGRRGDE
jgi:hypothetical protein